MIYYEVWSVVVESIDLHERIVGLRLMPREIIVSHVRYTLA